MPEQAHAVRRFTGKVSAIMLGLSSGPSDRERADAAAAHGRPQRRDMATRPTAGRPR